MRRVGLQNIETVEEKTSHATYFWLAAVQSVSASLYSTSMQGGVLFITRNVVFNIKDANSDHLTGFTASTSTVCSRVLVQT